VVGSCSLARQDGNGTALVMRLADRKLLIVQGRVAAARWLVPPGSTMKPLTLWALLESGKLRERDEYLCPGRLILNGRNMSCSHPPVGQPMNVSRAIAYSCNCFVAHFAQRLELNEYSAFERRIGFCSATGLLGSAEATGGFRPNLSGEQLLLQALGESFVEITPLELLGAYVALMRKRNDAFLAPIFEGLQGAVEYGTAQNAKLDRIAVAGKTGSVRAFGTPLAWFAGFAPSRSPEVVVIVLTQGYSAARMPRPLRVVCSNLISRAVLDTGCLYLSPGCDLRICTGHVQSATNSE
jgi:cell division protein FtsI/penicillin-binding protein 2